MWFPRRARGRHQLDYDVHVAAGRSHVRTNVPGLDQQLSSDFALDAWQVYIEASTKEVAAVRHVQVDLGVDGQVGRQGNSLFVCRKRNRTLEASGPTGGQQLLGVGADTR